MEKVCIHTATIRLDQLLKLSGAVPTGGVAKQMISDGLVLLNGKAETMRGKQVSAGDTVVLRTEDGEWEFQVVQEE